MQYRYIGKTGLRVSPICLGTMTFWTQADKKESFKIMDKAYERGINFFDMAEIYPVPRSGIPRRVANGWFVTQRGDDGSL